MDFMVQLENQNTPSCHFQKRKAMKIVDVDKLRYLVANVNFEVPKTRWISNFSYSMTMAKADVESKYEKPLIT
ncbi:receptor-like protein 12 isoform X3 [Gossypium australe]|uniref:Receptor-like protein 12 isoform X3 n=1 Tax=Gossypium australe TaxID=47621 RepID=A0A5B6VBY3_9ROSI|nr:receptor-like protein 12 isoform X3 [Gossypium australe]